MISDDADNESVSTSSEETSTTISQDVAMPITTNPQRNDSGYLFAPPRSPVSESSSFFGPEAKPEDFGPWGFFSPKDVLLPSAWRFCYPKEVTSELPAKSPEC